MLILFKIIIFNNFKHLMHNNNKKLLKIISKIHNTKQALCLKRKIKLIKYTIRYQLIIMNNLINNYKIILIIRIIMIY
jgi:hypothetical protein